MKKLLMIATMMVTALQASAQDDDSNNEVGVFYGFGSATNIVSSIGVAFSLDGSDKKGFWGPIGAEYFHRISPTVAVGATAIVSGCTYSSNDNASSFYITLMPTVKFNWLRKEAFGMYSSLAAGATYHRAKLGNDTESQIVFMGHVTALGAEFGGPVRVFLELGFGERGMLSGGVRYKF